MPSLLSMGTKILLVDDDNDVREVVKLFLERAGYIVEDKANGNFVQELNTATVPSLYILDRNLNGEDGLQLCRQIKSNPKTKDVPVLMLSADPYIAILSKAAGANGYIEKPFERTMLIKKVAGYIGE